MGINILAVLIEAKKTKLPQVRFLHQPQTN